MSFSHFSASAAVNNLFDPNFSYPEPPKRIRYESYVSEALNDSVIDSWRFHEERYRCTQPWPVFISAQTGTGKNHFVIHNLVPYAKRNNHRILYVSNRVALGHQQKEELLRTIETPLPVGYKDRPVDELQDIGHVTILTYQKLAALLTDSLQTNFNPDRYDFVVLDEPHYFYSDALFNGSTGFVLEKIPEKFCCATRIYMSATFEDVLAPIWWAERQALDRDHSSLPHDLDYYFSPSSLTSHFDENVFFYEFPRNYASYTCSYFKAEETLLPLIAASKPSEKWLFFVTSKDKGRDLVTKLKESSLSNSNPITADYLDSESRNSEDPYEQKIWKALLTTGRFQSKVLVTTSVLDNGFSIKDPKLRHIVLTTHDRTEFLQELGRCRLNNAGANVYIKAMTSHAHQNRKLQFKRYNDLITAFYSPPESQLGPEDAFRRLWHPGDDERRRIMQVHFHGSSEFSISINQMARWRIKRLGEQIDAFEQEKAIDAERAAMTFKAAWLQKEVSADEKYLDDILKENQQASALEHLHSFLKPYCGRSLNRQELEEFSLLFQQNYRRAFPKDTSINRGKKRTIWKTAAIRNHLEKLSSETCQYTLHKHIGSVECYEIICDPVTR